MTTMPFEFDDGGREASGRKGFAGDCVCRAIAIAAQRDYAEVYERLASGNASQRSSKHTPKGAKSARNGINVKRKWFRDYMTDAGFSWVPTMGIGTGCTTHLAPGELPQGRLVVSLSKHYAAVINGVIHDTSDPSRDGTRCVYGYWTAQEPTP